MTQTNQPGVEPLTLEQIRAIAARKGLVFWPKSGIVEYLRLAKNGAVIARKRKTFKTHLLAGRKAKPILFWCVEVDKADADTLLPASPQAAP